MKKYLCLWILSLLLPLGVLAQQTASGVVISGDDNFPIIGATVVCKENRSVGTATDMDGKFELNLPEGTKKLIISYIGMESQEVTPSVGMKIVLKSETEIIDDVVITGFQKMDRKMFTGAGTTINAAEAKIDGVADVSHALQGRVAGVSVQSVSGTFGAAPKLRVRAASTIYGNTAPLYVVDGVILEDVEEMSADDLSSGDAATLISSRIAGISADDIESFQILKDANATGLYGARARNGVIVITTKSGKKGKTNMSYSGEFTYRIRPSYSQYDIMNSQEQMSVYQEMKSKGWLNHVDMASGRVKNGGSYYLMNDMIYKGTLLNNPQSIAQYERYLENLNTDWFEELFHNNIQQVHSVSISGGTDKGTYRTSLSYRNDPGWTDAEKLDLYTASMNASYDFSKNLTLRINSTASYRKQKIVGTLDRTLNVVTGEYQRDFDINAYKYATTTSRTMAPYDKNGNYQYYRQNFANFNILNEMENNFMDLSVLDLKFQGELEWKPFKGMTLNGLIAYSASQTSNGHRVMDNSNFANAYRAADNSDMRDANKFLYRDPNNPDALPEVVMSEGGFYNKQENTMNSLYMRATANYDAMLNEDFRLCPMVGVDMRRTERSNGFNNGYGYVWEGGGVPVVDYRVIQQILVNGSQYYGFAETYDRAVGLFATASGSLKDKYTFNLTGRYDGSNRMGKSKTARWLPTWNVSAGWNVRNEEWMNDQNIFSSLNLRASYGMTADIGPATNSYVVYMMEEIYRPPTSENSDRESSLYISGLANEDLTWEKQYEFNFGMDMGFFNERLTLNADVYFRNGFDLIGLVETSGVGGEGYKVGNYGDMKAWGLEATVTTQNIVTKDFNWSTNLTFAHSNTEITNLKIEQNAITMVQAEGAPVEGRPVRGLYSYVFAGLTEDGLPQVYNHDGKATTYDINFQDRDGEMYLKYEGSVDPTITGGLNNSFRWKNFTASVFFTYQFGNKIRLNPEFASSYSDMAAMGKSFNNRWMVPGDEYKTNVPVIASARQVSMNSQLQYGYNAYNYSDVRVADGGFVRLKEISLGYTFDQPWVKEIGLNNLQCRLTASNLWLVFSDSKLNGQDPEFFGSGGVAMPTPKQITFKVSTNF
ncbi:MAG: SusC/RagA family TonB-linked outer membrane protein [Bacteroidaceae bacterium]|nr:SusC/RagA family TonB-linked outer membrane protein [Bacteroidaceae bacterium]